MPLRIPSPLRALFCGLAFAATAFAAEPARPNIVFIISDDHAWTDYGFMGHKQIATPHLDKLAARSAVFTRGYVPTALCRPALATFATGLYAHQHKISGNDPTLLPEMMGGAAAKGEGKKAAKIAKKAAGEPGEYQKLREQLIAHIDRQPTVAKLLGQQGYLSHQSGKWWEGSFQRGGFTHGMTRGFPQPGGRHGDDGLKIGREGMTPVFDFIDQAVDAKKPFFIWYAPFLPHTPHTPPDHLFQKYKAMGIASDHVARYYAMVEWFDETCGQLIDRIETKGLTRNTLFVYLADNGWIQQENGQGFAPRSKQSANEGGIRQPTMFSWPGVIQPGKRGDQLCSSVDIVPTLLAAAGATAPKNLPGYNLLPILKTGRPTPRSIVFGETYAHDIANLEKPEASLVYRWAIEGKWKLLLTYDGAVSARYDSANPRTEKRPQLFDLLADPHENRNLAAQNPAVVSRLAGKLQEWWPVTERKVLKVWQD
jgi:arylsulfatase A-like enzyme